MGQGLLMSLLVVLVITPELTALLSRERFANCALIFILKCVDNIKIYDENF